MKKLLAVILSTLTVAAMTTAVVPAVTAADPALTTDTETRGDWVGKYGAEGYYILGASYEEPFQKMPEYATIAVTDLMGTELTAWWAFWDEQETPECPYDPAGALWIDEAKTARRAACQFDGTGIDITVDVGDNTKKVSLYLSDIDAAAGNERSCEVILYDADMNEIEYIEVSDFIGGIYVSAEVTGKVTFEIMKTGGPNCVYSGIFFDPAGDAAPVETEAPETEAPETEAPETEAPETEAPETEAPETETPETEPTVAEPETVASEATAPETVETESAPQTNDIAVFGLLFVAASAGAALVLKRKEV